MLDRFSDANTKNKKPFLSAREKFGMGIRSAFERRERKRFWVHHTVTIGMGRNSSLPPHGPMHSNNLEHLVQQQNFEECTITLNMNASRRN